MRIILLGTGTLILDPQRPATTAILIEVGSERILFDAVCDLGELLLSTWHNGRHQPIRVYGPKGTLNQESKSPAFERLAEHIIASSGQAGKIASHAGIHKLVLTHFRKKSEVLIHDLIQDARANFKGELYIAGDGMVVEV